MLCLSDDMMFELTVKCSRMIWPTSAIELEHLSYEGVLSGCWHLSYEGVLSGCLHLDSNQNNELNWIYLKCFTATFVINLIALIQKVYCGFLSSIKLTIHGARYSFRQNYSVQCVAWFNNWILFSWLSWISSVGIFFCGFSRSQNANHHSPGNTLFETKIYALLS